ncbi:MAG TPA: hypothetical protein VNO30_01165 [Kofleriaceae bacterium]|nr:hypothetical protein [Kofleriaceae bacterium]
MLADLVRARGALERDELEEALMALLAAWRHKRDTRAHRRQIT